MLPTNPRTWNSKILGDFEIPTDQPIKDRSTLSNYKLRRKDYISVKGKEKNKIKSLKEWPW